MCEDKHCLDALTDYARDFASSLGWRGVVTTSVPLGPAGLTPSCRHNLDVPVIQNWYFMTLYEWRVTDVSLYAAAVNSCISQRTLLKASILMCYDCV